ncbi:serine hydrolase domain-containing protein [Ruegeria atlantica]|uniref:6-aminohexanoate-dimer hydrolase n=2 Tax=Ruegeria atlantica TaxID=81569 RepID=A0A0P1E0C4_9RHOB|nr:serine hydrolase [Ruegeria atlantica]CUH41251.1 6-aminohexanoate-dimer hydrolase [Ruegeria atlantica]
MKVICYICAMAFAGAAFAQDNMVEGRPMTSAEMGIMQDTPPNRTIDISAWDKGPDNRWAFQHISEFLHVANISRGSGPAAPLALALQDLSDLQFDGLDGQPMTVADMLVRTYTDGFLVMQDGDIVFEKYFNGMTPNTRHLLMSVSKSVTGTLAGILVNDGRLNPTALVTDYIPEMESAPGFGDATVRQVLDMTTAIVFSEDYADPDAEVVAHEATTAWRGENVPMAQEGVYAFATTIAKDASRPHGQQFHYASINTDVLGWLIERASGQRFADYMSAAIWSQLGADHDGQITVDYKGAAAANGGFVLTLRDLARFSQMVLDDGFYNGRQIVPSGWIDDIRFNGNNAAWQPTSYSSIWPDGFYRNQWYVTKDDHGSFFAVGVNGQHIWINPTTRTAIVKFSSLPVSADKENIALGWAAMDAIARSFEK